MKPAYKLDRIDVKILAVLQRNGRITNVELADAANLSPSPCLIKTHIKQKTTRFRMCLLFPNVKGVMRGGMVSACSHVCMSMWRHTK